MERILFPRIGDSKVIRDLFDMLQKMRHFNIHLKPTETPPLPSISKRLKIYVGRIGLSGHEKL